jgi:hypothetical protein
MTLVWIECGKVEHRINGLERVEVESNVTIAFICGWKVRGLKHFKKWIVVAA